MATYGELTDQLLRAFPELCPAYEKLLERMRGEIGPHVAFGDLPTPHLIELLESQEQLEDLRRIFDYLETLACVSDKLVQEVVALSVCERLSDKEEWLVAAWPYMGPKTRELTREVADYWGTSPNFPFA